MEGYDSNIVSANPQCLHIRGKIVECDCTELVGQNIELTVVERITKDIVGISTSMFVQPPPFIL